MAHYPLDFPPSARDFQVFSPNFFFNLSHVFCQHTNVPTGCNTAGGVLPYTLRRVEYIRVRLFPIGFI